MSDHWVNKRAKFPYVDARTWYSRYHLLGRKIERQDSVPSIHDRRVAGILVQAATRLPQDATLMRALASMEWITDAASSTYPLDA